MSSEREGLRGEQDIDVLSRVRIDALESPPELVVHDELGACPYLADPVARMPLRLPIRRLTPAEFERRLEVGNRRQGRLLYRTQCPSCAACEPIRILVDEFVPGRTQRRVLRRGAETFSIDVGPPTLSQDRVDLYNRHKRGRNLLRGDDDLDAAGYQAFLVDTCCQTFEIRYRMGDRLVGVSVVDQGERSLSAVYTYFDPAHEPLSPGVFSILTQIELCKRWGLPHLYLGLYIADCPRMVYKSGYLPHERLIAGRWTRFDRET
ncbi:arginyltransferase [Chondromyces crocatus]|uniref:Aspartate/glutamate leucyltransferase n=1 Tax=Chondromyces crocatus TaxID=52 RepID=A0A0K1EJS7_CHOCO|nr:arginyltransferase [Chondromyces crocatus]AKT40942.1 arginyl-tRNA-protein transferase [Chondromyces crocatus]